LYLIPQEYQHLSPKKQYLGYQKVMTHGANTVPTWAILGILVELLVVGFDDTGASV
jgi:hypothetical protein